MPKIAKNAPLSCNPDKAPPFDSADSADAQMKPRFCWLMWENLKPQDASGLSAYILTKFSDMEENLAGVILKTSAKDKGILLNHCPFCGTSLEAWLAPHMKKAEASDVLA